MAIATNFVTFEDTVTRIGTLLTIEPRPNAQNIKHTMKAFIDDIHNIPSCRSNRCGYIGMTVSYDEYMLTKVTNDKDIDSRLIVH